MEDLQKEYEIKVVFSQDKDCTSPSDMDDYQYLEVWHDNGGGGNFFIMKTERWAFESPEDVYKLLKEFENKLKKLLDERDSD